MRLPGRLVLLGHPVAHSLSPVFQNAALQRAGIPLTYEPLDVLPSALATVAALLREADAAGNVTVPHKAAFATLCAKRSPVADRVGAVNTFWVEEGSLVGDNTDVGGFEAAVEGHFGAPRARTTVAVLGAGGAAAAVLAAVERWEGARARVVARSRNRARLLVQRFAHFAVVAGTPREGMQDATLVVNATPLGFVEDAFPIEPALIPDGADVYDLAYRRGETPWVHACRARGLRAADGLSMLVEQGALSFERWFGRIADRAVMREALR